MSGDVLPDDLDFGQTIQIPRFGVGQRVFRRYTLQRILGRGGMGVVWLAEDEHLESPVALKVLPETLCHDRASVEALKRETKLGLHLAHANIVRIYDFQRDDHAAAISMEYVDGPNFSDVRVSKPQQVFDPPELLGYVEALCDALHYAHTRRKIVHRDLKPRNLMLNSEGDLKIADFGISRSISESMIMVTGLLGSTGSPPYISPQQWDGERPTPLDDIYSVGATLYELLTSKPPLLGVVDWQQVHSKVPPPISQRRLELGLTDLPSVSAAWEEAIAACLAKDSKERPQSIRELQARLISSNGASAVSPEALAAQAPVSATPEVDLIINDAAESFSSQVTVEDVSDDTVLITKALGEPKVELPAPPAIEIRSASPDKSLEQADAKRPDAEVPPDAGKDAPLVQLEPPAIAPSAPERPNVADHSTSSAAPQPLRPEVSEAKLQDTVTPPDTHIAEAGPILTQHRDDLATIDSASNEIADLPSPMQAAKPLETQAIAEEPAAQPVQPPPAFNQVAVTAPRPGTLSALNADFPTVETAKSSDAERITHPKGRMPTWVWPVAAAAVFVLCGISLINKRAGHGRPQIPLKDKAGSTGERVNLAATPAVSQGVEKRSRVAVTPPSAIVRQEVPVSSKAPSITATTSTPMGANSLPEITLPESSSSAAGSPVAIFTNKQRPPAAAASPVIAAVQDLPQVVSSTVAASARKDAPPAPAGAESAPLQTPPVMTLPIAGSTPKEVSASKDIAAPAAKSEVQPRKGEKVSRRAEHIPTPIPPKRAMVAAPPAASPKTSSSPARKKAQQPFEGGVPGG